MGRTNKKIKVIFTIILAVIILLGAYLYLTKNKTQEADAAWWNDSWMYRKSITVSNSSGGILTDFQVKILDNKDLSTDITAGKIQADLDDLRFTDINGTVLPYWIEDATTSSVDVWVKMSNIPTTGATVYFYYGNAQATSEQNGNNVFEFFDDFNDGDVSDWSKESSTIASGTVDGAVGINITPGGANYKDVEVYKTTTLPSSYTVETRVKDIGGGEYPGGLLIAFQDVNNWIGLEGSAAQWTERGENGGSDTGWIHTYTPNIIPTGWSKQRIDIPNDGNYKVWINGTFQATKALPYSFTRNGVGFCKHISYNNIFSDWIFVRKYASTDPTAGTPATEEKGGAPVASWSFDEGTGTTANDSSSNRNNGTLTNMASSADPNSGWQSEDKCVSGKCLAFDGTDDVVNVATISTSITNTVSYELWVRPTRDGVGSSPVYQMTTFMGKDGPEAAGGDLKVGYITGNKVRVYIENLATLDSLDSTNSIPLNQWSHIAVTEDGSTLKLYINGKLEGQKAFSPSFNINKIGFGIANVPTWSYYFKGQIDEPRVYPYARTASQIAKDYNAGLSGMGKTNEGTSASIGGKSNNWLTNGLVGHWKMDEASWNGTSGEVKDASGNGNNGTASGGATTGAGKFGNGGSFDGTDDYVETSNIGISGNQPITISFWTKSNATNNTNDFVSVGQSGSANGIVGVAQGTGPTNIFLNYWGGNNINIDISPINYVNEQVNIIYTYDGTTEKLYANGILKHTRSISLSFVNNPVRIGGRTGGYAGQYSNGKIDDVRIYNRALSPKEVSDLYNFAPGPVGYWNLDDATGTTAKDLSGNGNNGTLTNGPTWTTQGKYGGAVSFDGSDDVVNIGDKSVLKPINSFSLQAWFKPKASPTGNKPIFWDGDSSANAKATYDLAYTHSWSGCTDGSVGFSIGNGTTSQSICTPNAIPINQWHYLVAVYDGYSLKIYVNGVLQVTALTTISPSPSNYPLRFGNPSDTPSSSNIDGLLDDLKIYNYARTQKQIVEDMSAKGGSASGGNGAQNGSQVGYWKFDEGNGTTASNSGNGGSALNGTISGATWTNDGKFGKALSFLNPSGQVGQYVSTACPVFPLNSGDAITASFWVNPNSSQLSSNDPLLLFSQTFAVDIGKTAPFRIGFRPKSGGNTVAVSLANALPADTFTHVTIVFTQNSNVKFYINGILKQTSSFPYITDVCSSNFFIGGYSQAWNGSQSIIDELKIYNYALTESEIQLDYNQGKSMVLGSKGTESDGRTPSNSASRAYCPPGNVEGNCAPGLNPSPVGEWSLDDGSGTTAKDKSGNGLNGTVTGASWITGGKSGNALSFNGSSSYVSISDNSLLKPTTSISVGAWFNTRDKTAGQRIISKTDSSGYQISLNPLVEAACPAGTLCFQLNLGGSYYGASYAVSNLSNDTWYYVSGVYNGSTVKLYLNGREIASNNASGSITQGAIPVCVGSEPSSTCSNGGGYYFNGLIDEVKIYNYARTPAQIAWDYNRGAPVGWWRMDEGQGSTARDYSGNGNHGTLTNMDPATDWVAGKNNGALDFDGGNDYVNAGTNSSLDITSNITVSAWVKPDAVSNYMRIVSKQYATNETTANSCFQLGISSGSLWRWSVGDVFDATAGTAPTVGQWYHFVGTYDRSVAKMYVNGNLIWSGNYTGAIRSASSNPVSIGATYWSGSPYWLFDGQIDDVRIYNYALSAEQVKQVMNDGAMNFR